MGLLAIADENENGRRNVLAYSSIKSVCEYMLYVVQTGRVFIFEMSFMMDMCNIQLRLTTAPKSEATQTMWSS